MLEVAGYHSAKFTLFPCAFPIFKWREMGCWCDSNEGVLWPSANPDSRRIPGRLHRRRNQRMPPAQTRCKRGIPNICCSSHRISYHFLRMNFTYLHVGIQNYREVRKPKPRKYGPLGLTPFTKTLSIDRITVRPTVFYLRNSRTGNSDAFHSAFDPCNSRLDMLVCEFA